MGGKRGTKTAGKNAALLLPPPLQQKTLTSSAQALITPFPRTSSLPECESEQVKEEHWNDPPITIFRRTQVLTVGAAMVKEKNVSTGEVLEGVIRLLEKCRENCRQHEVLKRKIYEDASKRLQPLQDRLRLGELPNTLLVEVDQLVQGNSFLMLHTHSMMS